MAAVAAGRLTAVDHAARVQLAVVLGIAAAVSPVAAALLGWRVGPFRRLRAGDAAVGRLRARWLVVLLAVALPAAYAAVLVADLVLTNASGVYVIDPAGMPTMWLLAVAGPWLPAGFVAGRRHSREVAGPGLPLSRRARWQLVLASGMAAWSVYGPVTWVVAVGLGIGMSDSNSDVITAAIDRAALVTGLGCAVVSVVAVAAVWRGSRPTATSAALVAMPVAAVLAGVLAQWVH